MAAQRNSRSQRPRTQPHTLVLVFGAEFARLARVLVANSRGAGPRWMEERMDGWTDALRSGMRAAICNPAVVR